MTSFIEVLRQHSRQALALQGEHAEEFLKLLKALRDEMQSRAMDAGTKAMDAFAAQRIEAETKTAIFAMESKARGAYGAAARDAVDLALKHMDSEIGILSKHFDGHLLSVNLDAAKALADPAQGLLANHFETSVQRYGGELLNGVRQRLFIAVRTGDPVNDVVRDIAGQRGPLGIVGTDKAKVLVRTETSNAYGAAVHNGIAQASRKIPGLSKQWLHIGSYPCPTCMPLNGTTRPINGTWTIKSGKKSFKVSHNPAHPGCVCRVVASKPSWKAAIDKLGYGDAPSSKPTVLQR